MITIVCFPESYYGYNLLKIKHSLYTTQYCFPSVHIKKYDYLSATYIYSYCNLIIILLLVLYW